LQDCIVPTIETPMAHLHYDQTGEGPDIVWLSAGDMPGRVWREYQTPVFDAEYRNTTYDARGVGATQDHAPDRFRIEDHAEDCAALVREVCEAPVTLVGLSMGSLIAQQMSFEHPDLVRCAVLMGTSARKTGFIRDWERAEIDFRRSGRSWSPELAVAHYTLLMYPAEALGDDAMWERIRPVVERDYGNRDDESLAAQWEACLEYDSTERLPSCNVPLHVLSFSEDVQTPPQRGRLVADLAPRGTFHLLQGLGHGSLYGHAPDAVNAAIADILESELSAS
jgi:pimeloyl-ACP methyl ester carboxylesterase